VCVCVCIRVWRWFELADWLHI